MKLPRRQFLHLAAGAAVLPAVSRIAAAQTYPTRPIRLIVGYTPGGSADLTARLMGQWLSERLGQSLVAGTFSAGTQLWAAPVKIAGGLLVAAAICLPSLFIFTCLSGAQARLAEVCGLLAGLLMLMTILLVGFAPVAWIFSQSTESVAWMGALHLTFWLVATLFGVRFLKHGFTHASARSQAGVNVWIIIFLLVAVQMTTALRPILGKADTFFPVEKKFFIAHWYDTVAHSFDQTKTGTEASR